MIGIIVSSSIARKAKSGQKHNVIQFYKKLAANNKVDICFYAVKDLKSSSQTVKAAVYSRGSGKLETKQVAIPKVNLYRGYAYLVNKASIRKIEELRKKNIVFFNILSNAERGKLKIHNFLTTQREIAPYLPDTETLTYPKMVNMLERYGKLYIKPKQSAKGKNIRVLEKTAGGYKLTHVNKAKETVKTIKKNELKSCFTSTFSPAHKYIVQQAINSKTYKRKKFDFRVFTQKTKSGNWKVTGFYARIADKCPTVTNKDQGGHVKVNTKPLISKLTKKEIKKAAVKAAKAVEQKYPEIIDLGLDIAVDQNENVWLIEANFRPYRSTVDSRQYRILFEHAVWYYKNR
ncbi:YheC/YheD family protein [Evansella clarkii]|uniref:YheC/YheD family protein n=1 Tax=Evansella clarkii TaxID=79879 RepID=UPI0009964AF8|nr:YheC/YheD family protein [Evansella clarkii]